MFTRFGLLLCMFTTTLEHHLSGLIVMAIHPDMQKIRKLDFVLKIGYTGDLKVYEP